MQITVRNCLGVDRLEAAADPILLLSGPNGAGKSSTIRGLASALTGEIMPEGVAKKDSTLLVRDGADAARVVVTGPQGSAGVRWPEAERRTDGTPPKASPTAAGLTSLLDLPVKERARELDRLLKAAPSPADLAGALRDTDANFVTGGGAATEDEAAAMVPMALDPKDQRDAAIYRIVAGIWPTVEIDGFDGAHSRAADKGKELKGAWRQVTGEQYGSEKGAKWKAPGHELLEELEVPEADPVAHLTKQLAHVSSVAEGAARNFAIGQVDLDSTRAKAEQVPALQAAFDAAKKACDAANQAHNDVMAKRPGLIDVPMTCPHCSGAVQMEGGNLVAVSHAPSPEDITAARKRFDDHAEVEAVAKKTFEDAYHAQQDAFAALTEAKQAALKLEKNDAGSVPHVTEAQVELGRKDVERHARALDAAKKTVEAARLHRQIVLNQHIIDVLAPEGLRRKKLANVLDSFNEGRLKALCEAARWPAVSIGADMQIRFGRRIAAEPFSSEAQVMRARIILQAAIARIDGSDVVLIDRADKLDAAGRNGLFGLLKVLAADGIRAVVAMTASVPNKTVPDLAAAKLGASVWIANGVAQPLAEARAAFETAQQAKQAAE